MEVTLALLCDSASVDDVGRISVVGQFDHVYVDTYPLRMRPKNIVLRMCGSLEEFQGEQPFAIRAYNQEGREIGEILGTVEPDRKPQDADSVQAVAILPLLEPHIPEPGPYRFDVVICEEVLASIDIQAHQIAA